MRHVYVLILLLGLPIAAHGTVLPDGGVSAPEVAVALHAAGYPADVTTEYKGGPLIRSSTGKNLFFLHFSQCDAQLRCASIQFTCTLPHKTMAAATIETWNRERRFGRAFLTGHGTPWIAMDVEATGMTTEALAANIRRWITVLAGFEAWAGK